MLKKLSLPLFLFLFFIVTIPSFYFISSQSITITEKKVVYDLPYPGILPDHPLYFLKSVRDKIMDMTTRSNLKKGELYLHYSDKEINTAVFLNKKGKNKLAVQTLIEAEDYAAKIPSLFSRAKKQGEGPTAQLVDRVRASNAKHREVIEQLLKNIPAGDQGPISKAIKLNEQTKRELTSL